MDQIPLTQIKDTILETTINTINQVIDFSPLVVGAIGVVLVGLGMAIIIEKIIVSSSNKLRLGWVSQKIGLDALLEKAGSKRHPAEIIGGVLKGYIFMLFVISACKIVNLIQIADFLDAVIDYIPRIVVALIIVLIGIKIASTIEGIVHAALNFSSTHVANILSSVAKYSIIFFAVLAGLTQLKIASTLIEILFIGFITMVALAGGLALGLGGRDITKELIDDIRKKELQSRRKK